MSLLADALQPRLLADLSSITGKQENAAIADLIIAPKASFDLNVDDARHTFTVGFRTPEIILKGLAGDCSRFCVATFQSIESVGSPDKLSLPWDLIKLYYAAFYSGHLVLRLLGTPCCFLDSRHTTKIFNLADAVGAPVGYPLNAGTFKCEIDRQLSSLTFSKLTGRQSSTHDQFWKMFTGQLGIFANEVLSGPLPAEEAQAVFASIEGFRSMLQGHGAENWLSSMRNEFQYRHAHNVWFPSSLKKAEREKLARKMGRLYRDPLGFSSTLNSPLEDFISGCAFVIGLAHSLLRRIIELGNSKKVFLSYATQQFCVR